MTYREIEAPPAEREAAPLLLCRFAGSLALARWRRARQRRFALRGGRLCLSPRPTQQPPRDGVIKNEQREKRKKKKEKEKKFQPPSSHFRSQKVFEVFFFPSASLPSGMSRAPPRSSNSPHSGREHTLRRLCVDAQRSETQEGLRAGTPSADGFVALLGMPREREKTRFGSLRASTMAPPRLPRSSLQLPVLSFAAKELRTAHVIHSGGGRRER